MPELHFYKKGKAVRLTDQAHALLAVKSDDYGVTQKEIASEAILMLVKGKNTNKELHILLNRATSEIHSIRYAALGAFFLGAVVGGTLIIAAGVLW